MLTKVCLTQEDCLTPGHWYGLLFLLDMFLTRTFYFLSVKCPILYYFILFQIYLSISILLCIVAMVGFCFVLLMQ